MQTSDFDYDLPPDLIAQRPAQPRDSSRLLLCYRDIHRLEHHHFRDLPELLEPGDQLILNQTRVIPARLYAHKEPGGGKVELLLLKPRSDQEWEVLVGGKGLTPGRTLRLVDGPGGVIQEDLGDAKRLVRFTAPIDAYMMDYGKMPLPPYIHEPLQDQERYQTVFSREPGSAAAPTAGLHFTDSLFHALENRGIGWNFITLHVGLDTFAPVRVEDPSHHPIHQEWCQVSAEVIEAILETNKRGGRVIAVGTTAVRALETAARAGPERSRLAPFTGPTDLFILPGFSFRVVEGLITNFHLPRSSLLMLVAAFAGRSWILKAYGEAMRAGYRFYSFGDTMLIMDRSSKVKGKPN